MTNAIVPERVTELRKAKGMSQADLAKMIGASQQAIDQIERGKTRRSTRLHELATALGTDPDYLLGNEAPKKPVGLPVSSRAVPYAGIVAAGEFRSVDEYFDQDAGDHMVPASVSPHPAYPNLQQMAFLVRGDSMDEVDIRDGMWAVGASYADYVDRIGELDNGNYVVVERTRHGGSERQLTIKEVQFARRGMRLIPRSSNTRHKEFFVPLDVEADPDKEQIRVLAVVLWVGRDFDPRSRK